jgi:hypothetical protein
MDHTTRPADLARELSVDAKRIRRWLRGEYPDHRKHDPWHLTAEQADAVRRRFRQE